MKTIFITATIVLMSLAANAQQEHSFTNYFEVNPYYNPAATGNEETQNITGLFRKQWVGLAGSPMSGGILYDRRLDKLNMGLGGFVFTDFIGVTMMNSIVANYSYRLKLNDKHTLAFGVDAGVDIYTTDHDRLVYWDEDEMFDNQQGTNVVPHIGAGVQYSTENLYVGFSVPRLVNFNNNSPISIKAQDLPSIVSNYYLNFGYRFDLNSQFKMQINALGKYTGNVMPQGDLNAMVTYNNMIGLGVGYKSLGFATTYLHYTYQNVVTIGYGFDFTLTRVANYSNGSHEILVKYRLPNKSKKKKEAAASFK